MADFTLLTKPPTRRTIQNFHTRAQRAGPWSYFGDPTGMVGNSAIAAQAVAAIEIH